MALSTGVSPDFSSWQCRQASEVSSKSTLETPQVTRAVHFKFQTKAGSICGQHFLAKQDE